MILADAPVAASRPLSATLVSSARITPANSPEDVRHLVFETFDPSFDIRLGQCLRLRVPGRFGQAWHERLYSLADLDVSDPERTEFALLVRRCHEIDDFNGERHPGVASNHLCDLKPGERIEFCGPVGHPFPVPSDRHSPMIMIGMGTGIAPFRGLVRRIYETLGTWDGPVRLFYGARSGMEMLYMNEQNADIAQYYDEASFKAFQAVSPRPHLSALPALGRSVEDNADELRSLLEDERTHVYVAGPEALKAGTEVALARIAGAPGRWALLRQTLIAGGRWHEVLY
ncbi:FAD-binding oxidoreductase [Rubrivivax sp. JA1024]|nr:FAD-binding oxidoreductase [Rubrivivax sp. JA1024]